MPNPLDAALARLEPMTGSLSTWAKAAHLMVLVVPKSEYFDKRIARELVIRDAISGMCAEWVVNNRQPRFENDEDAFCMLDRFHYAYELGETIRSGGFVAEGKSENEVLLWLLIDSWERFSLSKWKADLKVN